MNNLKKMDEQFKYRDESIIVTGAHSQKSPFGNRLLFCLTVHELGANNKKTFERFLLDEKQKQSLSYLLLFY